MLKPGAGDKRLIPASFRCHQCQNMPEGSCPNIQYCRLVNKPGLSLKRSVIRHYMRNYCTSNEHYLHCRRFEVKQQAGFCPDFVLPDSPEDIASIIERFDEGNN